MTSQTCPPPKGGDPTPQGDAAVVHGRSTGARTAALIGASVLAGLFLAACGGDYDAPPAPPPTTPVPPPPPPPPPPAPAEVPASAADSSASLEAFAISQPLSETAEPLALDLVPTFPTSETDEPIQLPS